MTIKIKDRYFNYDNISLIDFEIWENSDKRKFYRLTFFWGEMYKSFDVTEEEYHRAQERLELGIIKNYVFIDLIEED